jgi:hypothetical protein
MTGNRIREDNIKMDLKETGYEVMDWIHMVHWLTFVNRVIKI